MNNFSIDEQIFVNQFSQGLVSLQRMDDWFCEHNEKEKREVLHNLFYMFVQAHLTYEEIEVSVKELKMSKSHSAIKLLNRNKPFDKFGYEICTLPENELKIGFNILILILRKADNRRKQKCGNSCRHWWHKDLSDSNILKIIKENKFIC